MKIIINTKDLKKKKMKAVNDFDFEWVASEKLDKTIEVIIMELAENISENTQKEREDKENGN